MHFTRLVPYLLSIALSQGFYLRDRDTDAWTWGYVGDSWASGVAYDQASALDNNAGGCLRYAQSAAPQINSDQEWWSSRDGFAPDLRDASCSGSQLVNIWQDAGQVLQTGSPNIIVMTSGISLTGQSILPRD